MSTFNGPGIVTKDLIFSYDMGNQYKSYIGAPITNLATFPALGTNWINSGNATFSDNDTSEVPPDIPNRDYFTAPIRVVSCQTTTASTQGQQCGYMYTSVQPSTQYTMSLWFKKNRDNMSSYGPYLRQNVNNNWHSDFNYNGETNNALWPTNQWIRIKTTFTTSSNESAVYLSNYIGEYVGDKVCYAGGQLELGGIANSLAQGTRAATQSVLDLVGTNTITANNITYSSDKAFSFNGSNSYLSIPYSAAFNTTSQLSIEAWVKFDADSDDFIFEKSDVNTQYSLFSHGNDIVFRTFHSGDGSYHTQAPLKTSVGVANGQWTHIIGSWDGQTKRIYINGVLKDSATKSGALVTTSLGSSVGRFGGNSSGYFFNGSIAKVAVYSKGLTESEVRQNFNALRGRYGL